VLIHQIPPQPPYFRQKVGRRLARAGAVAIKNSVYVVPFAEQALEDLQWIAREISNEGGEATICRATFVEGLNDQQLHALFHTARDADYAALAEEAREVLQSLPRRDVKDEAPRAAARAHGARLRKRFDEIATIDFFGAPGRESAESLVKELESQSRAPDPPDSDTRPRVQDYQGRVWVTRKNVHVDRIASAWLIGRFIDPNARFKFVSTQGYARAHAELTFDMYEGTFTHVGDACTFETLLAQFSLREPGLQAIAEIVHDIDVKDGKFARSEAAGVAALIAGIALSEQRDEDRIVVGGRMFDALLQVFRRKRGDS